MYLVILRLAVLCWAAADRRLEPDTGVKVSLETVTEDVLETIDQEGQFLTYFINSFSERADDVVDEYEDMEEDAHYEDTEETEQELIEVEEFLRQTDHLETYKNLAQLAGKAPKVENNYEVKEDATNITPILPSAPVLSSTKKEGSVLGKLVKGAMKKKPVVKSGNNILPPSPIKEMEEESDEATIVHSIQINKNIELTPVRTSSVYTAGTKVINQEADFPSVPEQVIDDSLLPTIEVVSNQEAQDRSDILGYEIGVDCIDDDSGQDCTEANHDEVDDRSSTLWPRKIGMKRGELPVRATGFKEETIDSNTIDKTNPVSDQDEEFSTFDSLMSIFF